MLPCFAVHDGGVAFFNQRRDVAMPIDPGIHAELTLLIQQEKKLREELEKLAEEEMPQWRRRVQLAREKGMEELAEQAIARAREVRTRMQEIEHELEVIDMDKSMLRRESRRPSGVEVERAEALLGSFRQSGLVDPDEAALEREFEELRRQQGGEPDDEP